MGKPPWMRQTRVTADGETEFHDTGFPTSFLSIFIGLSMPRNPRKAFSMHRAVWWTVACLGFVALLIAICIVLAFLRNKQTNILLAVLAFLTLIAWIPGEMKSIRRCVAEQRDASWQCVAGSFLALDLIFVPMLAATALTSW